MRFVDGDGDLLAPADQVLDADLPGRRFIGTDDQGQAGPGAVGRLELRLGGSAVERPVGSQAGGPQAGRQVPAGVTAGEVHHEGVEAAAGRQPAGRAALASRASRIRSTPRANPTAGVGGPPMASTRPS